MEPHPRFRSSEAEEMYPAISAKEYLDMELYSLTGSQ